MIPKTSTTPTEFISTHALDFLQRPWIDKEFFEFRIGTCHGLYRSTSESYDILAIVNDQPNNGHLDDVFQWFENSCHRDQRELRVLEVWNKNLKRHLIVKCGFRESKADDVVKSFRP
jgi:hypothetical protein